MPPFATRHALASRQNERRSIVLITRHGPGSVHAGCFRVYRRELGNYPKRACRKQRTRFWADGRLLGTYRRTTRLSPGKSCGLPDKWRSLARIGVLEDRPETGLIPPKHLATTCTKSFLGAQPIRRFGMTSPCSGRERGCYHRRGGTYGEMPFEVPFVPQSKQGKTRPVPAKAKTRPQTTRTGHPPHQETKELDVTKAGWRDEPPLQGRGRWAQAQRLQNPRGPATAVVILICR